MLAYFRGQRNPILLYFVVGVICIVMLSFGLVAKQYSPKPSWVLKVNGKKVPLTRYLASYHQIIGYFQSLLKGQFDPSMLQYFQVYSTVLENLKERELLDYFAQNQHLVFSTEFVRDQILKEEGFKDDGQFSFDQYKRVLARGLPFSPIKPKDYEDYLGQIYVVQTLNRVIRNAFHLPKEHQDILEKLRQIEYKVTLYPLTPKHIQAKTKLKKEEIAAFASDTKNLPAIQNAYFKQSAKYSQKGTYEAKHILLPNVTEEEKKTSKDLADQLYTQLVTDPGQFEALVKKHSVDPSSKDKGGRLGKLTSGEIKEELEAALKTLKPGEVGKPIVTNLGIHIPVLIASTPEATTPLEKVKSELAEQVLMDQKRGELVEIYQPILISHFKNRDIKEVKRILTTTLRIKPEETGFFSPYQSLIQPVGQAFPLKQYVLHNELEAGDFVEEIIKLGGTPYVIQIKAKKEAFEATTKTKGAKEQFLTQMNLKWQDHVYAKFKKSLEQRYPIIVNQEAIAAFKKRHSRTEQAAQ